MTSLADWSAPWARLPDVEELKQLELNNVEMSAILLSNGRDQGVSK